MIRRSLVAALLAAVLAIASVGSAFAHECVISSRSSQGNEGATHSKVWGKLTLSFILVEFFGLTDEQAAWAVDNRGDLPEFWVVRFDKTIGEGSSNPNLANGTGLDHLEDLVGFEVFLLAEAAREAVPG